jgi:UDP-GlcNAc:undecaprenyl-phosphate GlcNAc-1-phosphate transferase
MACAGTFLILPGLIRLAPMIGALDDPTKDTRRIHRKIIPRIGGIAIAIIFIGIYLLQGHELKTSSGFIGGIAVLTLVGVIDDTRGLSPKVKMAGQILAMMLATLGSGIVISRIPIPLLGFASIENYNLRLFFSCFVGVGFINAINLIDGLDGLAAGIGAIASGGIAVLAALAGNIDLCLVSTILLGCLLAVLAFNSHPARIFLGDTGSMLIGYMIACFGFSLANSKPMGSLTAYSPILPIMLLVVPCADCIWVMVSRVIRGRPPFRGDRTHVHHQVLGMGLKHQYAVMVLLLISLIVTLITIGMRNQGDDVLFLTSVCFVQGIIGGIRFMVRAPSYRRVAIRILKIRRKLLSLVSPRLHPSTQSKSEHFQKINKVVLHSAFIGLCAMYAFGGLRRTELLGWSACTLLAVLFIVIIAVRNERHHFVFFISFGAIAFLAMCSDLQLRQYGYLLPIGILRSLIFLAFASACVELLLSQRLYELITTPLELLVLGGGIALILFVSEQRDINVAAVAASSLALFVILKACGGNNKPSHLPFLGVTFALTAFIILQATYCGMANPLPRLFNIKDEQKINQLTLIQNIGWTKEHSFIFKSSMGP